VLALGFGFHGIIVRSGDPARRERFGRERAKGNQEAERTQKKQRGPRSGFHGVEQGRFERLTLPEKKRGGKGKIPATNDPGSRLEPATLFVT
jgi:hypothetical protein